MERISRILDKTSRLSEGSPLLFASLLIPFFEPTFVEQKMWLLDKIFFLFQLVALVTALINLITKKISLSPFYLCVVGYQAYLCVVTLFCGGNLFGIVSSSARVFTIATLLEIGLRRNSRTTMKVLRNYSLLILAIMFISSVLAPHGLYISPEAAESGNPDDVNFVRYFLGHKNSALPFLMPGFVAATVLWKREKTSSSAAAALAYYTMLALTVVIIDSKTALIVSVLLIASVFLAKLNLLQKINPFVWLASAVCANASITIFRLQNSFPALTKLLGRDVTFTGRTTIWDAAIELFIERPIFGYGYVQDATARSHFLGLFNKPHNIYFSAVYYGGLIGLLLMISSFILSFKSLLGRRNEIAVFMALFLFLVLIEGIFESIGNGGLTLLVAPLVMTYCTPSFDVVTDEPLNDIPRE